MKLIETIQFLDLKFARTVRSTPAKNITSWENTQSYDVTVTVNETDTTYTQPRQLCLKTKNNTTYLYINHLSRRNLTKIPLTTIEDIGV